MTSEHNSGELDEPSSEDTPEPDKTDDLIHLVEEGIEETFQEFEEYPQMFSTEADVKLRLFKNIGSKNYRYMEGRESELWCPHPDSKASWVRSEWKKSDREHNNQDNQDGQEVWTSVGTSEGDDEDPIGPIDLVVIEAKEFDTEDDPGQRTKKGGKYGYANMRAIIEIKGPRSPTRSCCKEREYCNSEYHENPAYCDIKKVAKLLGNGGNGYVLVFDGDDSEFDVDGLKRYAREKNNEVLGDLKVHYSQSTFSSDA